MLKKIWTLLCLALISLIMINCDIPINIDMKEVSSSPHLGEFRKINFNFILPTSFNGEYWSIIICDSVRITEHQQGLCRQTKSFIVSVDVDFTWSKFQKVAAVIYTNSDRDRSPTVSQCWEENYGIIGNYISYSKVSYESLDNNPIDLVFSLVQ